MLFTIGSRVKLKSTGDIVTVSAILEEGMIEVKLPDGLGHIPVPREAITYPDDYAPDEKSGGARFVSGKALSDPEIAADDLGMQYAILSPWGIQLCFDPVLKLDGSQPDRYRVYLVNDLMQSVIFAAKLLLGRTVSWERVGQLNDHAFFELGDLRYDELNQQAAIDLEVRELRERGTGPRLHQLIRLKPKVFFRQLRTAPLLNRKVHHFIVFPDLQAEVAPKKAKGEDLRKYTKEQIALKGGQQRTDRRYYQGLDLAAKTAFPRELDLHLENLQADGKVVPKGQELSTQLAHFERYLNEAIRLDIDRVIIIHGKGTGVLRKAIAERLKKHPRVKDFKNGFLEKYDHGATEVFLA
ncbi:MAG: Smr/MutS family protein [Bacteroidota bacterium]